MAIQSPQNIIDTLSKNKMKLCSFGVKRIGLFGSFATGQANDKSDIDFVVEFEKTSFDSYMDLKFFLEETFGRSVDLVTARALKPRLKEIILNQAIYA